MAIDFPASPAVGQRYAYAGINYVFTAQGIWTVVNTGLPAASTSKITVQKFTADGTYVPTPGTQFAIVECIGGGGAGGVAQSLAADTYQGGGGGGGGYSRSYLTAAQIGTSQTVTIGAGGVATSTPTGGGVTNFGSLCIANGGGPGGFGSVASYPASGSGAVPGVGDVAVAGTPGGMGLYSSNAGTALGAIALTGNGGPGPLGGGSFTGVTGPGQPGTGYGSGGAGGNSYNTAGGVNGGNGAPGICIITEYNITAAGPQGPTGPMGGTTGVSLPGGRLTLSATNPVMQGNIEAATTIYYLPYVGDRIPIFDGANMVMTTIPAGLSTTTTDTTKNPSALGSSSVSDWFVWNDGGTIRLCHGPDWTDTQTRSAGTALVRVNGIWTNAAPITNGPAPNKGTYVGTTHCPGIPSLHWRPSAHAVGGLASLLLVFNAYNRVQIVASQKDDTSSWTYGGGTRPVNGSSNNRIYWADGLGEVFVAASYTTLLQQTTGLIGQLGVAGPSMDQAAVAYQNIQSDFNQMTTTAEANFKPALGISWAEAQENSSGGADTFYGGGFALFRATMEI